MVFSEKLSLLMELTHTTNSVLARTISLDPSFISRLRRGKRRLPKDQNYVHAMAQYFAKHCRKDYSRHAILKIMGAEEADTYDEEQIAAFIEKWLLTDLTQEAAALEGFLGDLSRFTFKKTTAVEIECEIPQGVLPEACVYYGEEGKREAVVVFLSAIIQCKTPQTIYLYSDEDMGWMTDREFMAKWSVLMKNVIMRGNKIVIIHTVSRDLDEMLTAIREWMPLYMTGAIEPYYYPKKRDGIYRRTLFIAPETAAISSTSIGRTVENAANYFTTGRLSIAALVEEYQNYLKLCRPLMRIFSPVEKETYYQILTEFEQEKTDTMIKVDSLSVLTLPEEVVRSTAARIQNEQVETLLQYYENRTGTFEKMLKSSRTTEIISLADIATVKANKVIVPFSYILYHDNLYYTKKEYIKHLEHILFLLESYDNYQVCVTDETDITGYSLYVKEDLGVIVAKTRAPSIVLAMNESNMTASYWNFLEHKAAAIGINKQKAAEKLRAYIKSISLI